MKYLISFHTTLKASRYLSRALAILLWLLITFISVFYIVNALHEWEAEVHRELNLNADQTQRYIQCTADVVKGLKCVAGSRLSAGDAVAQGQNGDIAVPNFEPLYPDSNCSAVSNTWCNSLQSLAWLIHYWRDNFTAIYDLDRIFLIGSDNLCMANFGLRNVPVERDQALKALHQHIERYRNAPQNERGNNLFWISQGVCPGVGYFYALTPVYMANRLQTMLSVEQTTRMESFFTPGNLSMSVTIFDDNSQPLISLAGTEGKIQSETKWMQERVRFGYSASFRELVLRKSLAPSSLSIIYSVSVDQVLERIHMLIISVIVLNILTRAMLFALARIYERRIFILAENDAQRLEEYEQFDRRIMASAPVGICILRTVDGTNILSNELAHNYLNMLTHEDRQWLTQIIYGQQVNLADILTSNHTSLQVSFIRSRYRNESVAIYMLVDVSAHMKIEESLQEMAQTAEQTSQSKSIFLATVSHELHTPLYGITGNPDLLQTKTLPKGVDRLVMAINNSFSLLLKIISDILDFSKIEFEQPKTEPREFSPHEVTSHISASYLPLVVRKQLGLYYFTKLDIPEQMSDDPIRLQQVISNLLSNAIKSTDTGCIILHVQCAGDYLQISIRDTGEEVPAREVLHLFDPFFQVGTGVQRNFQDTGLDLVICGKLINMMDGDIAVETRPGMGSRFTIRIPLYDVQNTPQVAAGGSAGKACWLTIHNTLLVMFVTSLFNYHNLTIRRHAGETPDADGVLLTDDEVHRGWQGDTMIIFYRRHVGIPQERAAGEWLRSIATPHKLLPLLGRTFYVALDSAENSQALIAPSAQIGNNNNMIILVVDDRPINRHLLAGQLGSLGYQCITADDGVDAFNVLSKQHIDIVLSDVNMPNMGGYYLTQCIRQLGLTLPVIDVTANALAEEKQHYLESGMDSCLSKPVTLDVLKQTLTMCAARVRNGQE